MTKILIVDDHRIFREGMQRLFDQVPVFQVVAMTDSGHDAIALTRQFSPDVVVMDICMPDLNGIDATRRIVEECPATRVIALTMHSERHLVVAMLKAGASGYLCKDEAFDNLLEAIETVQTGGTYLPPRINSLLVRELRFNDVRRGLSPRETEVLRLLARGRNVREIAAELYVSVKTVETHRSNIMKKLELRNLADLTRYAISIGLVDVALC